MMQDMASLVPRDCLDRLLLVTIRTNRYISNRTAELAKSVLLRNGASPLHRDARGFLLITNVRGALYWNHRRKSRYSQIIPHYFLDDTSQTFEQAMHFDSVDTQWALVECLSEAGANWHPRNHALFPDSFRERIRTLLLCNLRSRHSGVAYLPKDPLHLVIAITASLEFADEESQLMETRKLLASSYEKFKMGALKKVAGNAQSLKGKTREEIIDMLVERELSSI